MFKIDVEDLVVRDGYTAVIPGRPDSNFVRTEKKYDRHSVGMVVLDFNARKLDEDEPIVRIERGDIVFYDDSNAVETEMVVDGNTEKIEIIKFDDIVGYAKKGKK